MVTDDEVVERLRSIHDPCSLAAGRPVDIVDFGLVREARGGPAPRVVLRLTEPTCMFRIWFVREVRAVLGPQAVVDFAPADDLWDPPTPPERPLEVRHVR